VGSSLRTSECLGVELRAVRGDITRGKSRYGNSGVFVHAPAVAGGVVALRRAVQRSSTLADWNEDVTFWIGPVQLDGSRSRLSAPAPHRVASCRRCRNKQT